jgi:CheY-like chemotaxis protein
MPGPLADFFSGKGLPMISVLVVEDSEEVVELVELALEGWIVHSCPTGKGALEVLRGCSPDLLLLDSQLEDGPAADWLQQLSRAYPGPIVWFSREPVPAHLAAHVTGQIAKPVQVRTVKGDLQRFVGP